jgi:D-tyrosyl-tRNA(Tyr) deacylase
MTGTESCQTIGPERDDRRIAVRQRSAFCGDFVVPATLPLTLAVDRVECLLCGVARWSGDGRRKTFAGCGSGDRGGSLPATAAAPCPPLWRRSPPAAYNARMRVLLQRVSRASVTVGCERVAEIGNGFLALVGVGHGDTAEAATRLAAKTARLRVFEDDAGLMNLALGDVDGAVLAVSQFTLYADTRKGNRPSFTDAAPPERGEAVYGAFVEAVRAAGVPVQTGIFGAHMHVDLVNDGPVTILLEG